MDDREEPSGIERLGVHLFEAGTEGAIERGMDASRAAKRRQAKQARKQYRRRCLRKRRLLLWLQEMGLTPPGDVGSGAARNALLQRIDADIRKRWEPAGTAHRVHQLLPYRLRAEGLKRRLEPEEVGRALYHLAQRRGFLSNRRQLAEEAPGAASGSVDESARKRRSRRAAAPGSTGEVETAIDDLKRRMEVAGCATLAEYFTTLDPTGKIGERIRSQWTPRDLYLQEFDRLWDEQAKYHPIMSAMAPSRSSVRIRHRTCKDAPSVEAPGGDTPLPLKSIRARTYREEVQRAIFYQRPLKGVARLVGKCSLVRKAKRAPRAHPIFQRFRILQQVNNLRVRFTDGTERNLSDKERARLIALLESQATVGFSKLRTKKWFGKDAQFNLERGSQKELEGNITDARCRSIFGAERWRNMSDAERGEVVNDLIVWIKPKTLAERGRLKWGLADPDAVRFGNCVLEAGYAAHSVVAYERLVARMAGGAPYMTALTEEFKRSSIVLEDLLAPFLPAMGDPRNPTVTRALTELRKLVNSIVRRYGKPAWIRLELARDLKRPRKARERLSEEMRARESSKNNAREEILKKIGIVRSGDVERYLLAEECGFICPYTGKTMDRLRLSDIIGSPEFEVEHIWPRSKCLDNSLLNKTLCHVTANRAKRNLIPFEAYGGQPAKWCQILDRVRAWPDSAGRRIKLARFLAEAIPPEHRPASHLAETRKISALTAEYLGRLYGGLNGTDGRQRIWVTTGILTKQLRDMWGLNSLLSVRNLKERDDHRHHAIDALVVALTNNDTIRLLQTATAESERTDRRAVPQQDDPWPGFFEEARQRKDAINVSYRQSRAVRGALHEETLYVPLRAGELKPRLRKELGKLTPNDIPRIVDTRARLAVSAAIESLRLKPKGASKAYTDFAERSLHPSLTSDQPQWVHKVQVRTEKKITLRSIGSGDRERHVKLGANHHLAILERTTEDGIVWEERVFSLMDCHRRNGRGERVDRTEYGDGRRLLFTLAPGEYIEMDVAEGSEERALYRVTNISEGQSEVRLHTDGRPATLLRADKKSGKKDERVRIPASKLQRLNARKVAVTHLGEIRNAGG